MLPVVTKGAQGAGRSRVPPPALRTCRSTEGPESSKVNRFPWDWVAEGLWMPTNAGAYATAHVTGWLRRFHKNKGTEARQRSGLPLAQGPAAGPGLRPAVSVPGPRLAHAAADGPPSLGPTPSVHIASRNPRCQFCNEAAHTTIYEAQSPQQDWALPGLIDTDRGPSISVCTAVAAVSLCMPLTTPSSCHHPFSCLRACLHLSTRFSSSWETASSYSGNLADPRLTSPISGRQTPPTRHIPCLV